MPFRFPYILQSDMSHLRLEPVHWPRPGSSSFVKAKRRTDDLEDTRRRSLQRDVCRLPGNRGGDSMNRSISAYRACMAVLDA
jgi:hypothetical protein